MSKPERYWLNQIATYEREFKKWESRAEKILKRYRDDRPMRNGNQDSRFNILWSNVQTLVPATFSRLPQPDVSRRFRDNDPVGRVAALMVERGLDFEIQHYKDYRATLAQCVTDRFLPGRGTAWIRYEPHIRRIEGPDAEGEATEDNPHGESAQGDVLPENGLSVTEDVDIPEELEYECAPVDYVHWRDFGHTVARTWEEVGAVWRRVYMTRAMCIERFGEDKGKTIPLDSRPNDDKNKSADEDVESKALIYEIWDKEEKRAYWLSKSLGKYMDDKDDPLGLEEFFPCPKPLYATLTADSLVPVPDFTLYQDQARSLDVLSDRIDGLIEALRVRGVYNGEFTELSRLFTEGENNTLIPVKNWMAFAEKAGLKGAIDLVDIQPIANALSECYQAMEQVKSQVYEITGISDIVRGQSEASETATAQQIKGQYASMRLNSYKREVAEFAADILRLKAQVMLKKFAPETLVQISGAMQFSEADQALVPQALQLLQNEPLREFRIDITADSLVQMDESQEKKDRMEMIQAVGSMLRDAQPVVTAAPDLAPMVMQLIKFGVTAFKIGKTVEGTIDEALDKMQEALKAQQGQQKPDPEMMKVQAEAQAEQAKLQAQTQVEQMKAQIQQQMEQARLQADLAIEQARAQADMQIEQQRMALEARFDAERQAREMEMSQMKAQIDAALQMRKAELDASTKIAVAEISADATLTAAQESAADNSAKD